MGSKTQRRKRNLLLTGIPDSCVVKVKHPTGLYDYISTGDIKFNPGDTVVVRNIHGLALGVVDSIHPLSILDYDKYDYMPVVAKVNLTLDKAITEFIKTGMKAQKSNSVGATATLITKRN